MKTLLYLIVFILYTNASYSSETRGKKIYNSKCIACHNKNPNLKGNIGPDLVTTPYDAFSQKVTQGTYPSGYTPKRKTKAMPKFPHLKEDLEYIYKWIQTHKKE